MISFFSNFKEDGVLSYFKGEIKRRKEHEQFMRGFTETATLLLQGTYPPSHFDSTPEDTPYRRGIKDAVKRFRAATSAPYGRKPQPLKLVRSSN